MSSMTIDQLKKTLTEQGITLPSSRAKKADYIKLYNQYSTVNDSLGDVYASDDENPPRTGSQSVSSSTSPGKSENILKDVENLSDDELYLKLKEFDPNIGPILKNTRRVYEKKLIKLLSSGKATNNYANKPTAEHSGPSVDEFSDSDIEVISRSPRKTENKTTRKSSVLRDSPKPSMPESSKPETERSFTSSYEFNNRSSTPSYSSESKTSRYSYIETVPKGSSYGFIEETPDLGISSDLRQRYLEKFNTHKYDSDFINSEKYNSGKLGGGGAGGGGDIFKHSSIDDQYKGSLGGKFQYGKGKDEQFKSSYNIGGQYKPSLGLSSKTKAGGPGGEPYVGSWEPNINRYLGGGSGAGVQKKMSISTGGNSAVSGWIKKLLGVLLLLAVVLLIFYLYKQWSSTDPYKMLEDDAERTIQQLEEGSGGY